MSEFSEAFNRAYAIHRACSKVMSKKGYGAPVDVADVIQQLSVETWTIPEKELVGTIASAAKDAGLE